MLKYTPFVIPVFFALGKLELYFLVLISGLNNLDPGFYRCIFFIPLMLLLFLSPNPAVFYFLRNP